MLILKAILQIIVRYCLNCSTWNISSGKVEFLFYVEHFYKKGFIFSAEYGIIEE